MVRANFLTAPMIAERATRLFVRKGFGPTSMADIGKSCGILKGSLYYHFESKESLLLYVLESLKQEIHQLHLSYNDQPGSDVVKLRSINRFLKQYFLDNEGCLVAAMAMEREVLGKKVQGLMHEIFQSWKLIYRSLFRNHMTGENAERYAIKSIIHVEGAIVWFRVTGDKTMLEQAFMEMENLLSPQCQEECL